MSLPEFACYCPGCNEIREDIRGAHCEYCGVRVYFLVRCVKCGKAVGWEFVNEKDPLASRIQCKKCMKKEMKRRREEP